MNSKEIVIEINKFLKDESKPKEIRDIINGLCNTIVNTKDPNHPYFINCFKTILDGINYIKSNDLDVNLNILWKFYIKLGSRL